MTVAINVTNSWPITLPLPFIDYTGSARVPTIISPEGAARSQRRSRWKSPYAAVNVRWKLDEDEYLEMVTYWDTTLGNGTAKFTMEIRYPQNSALSTWICQFVGALEVVPIENGIREVVATLQILTLSVVTDKAAIIPQQFTVMDTSSTGLPMQDFQVQPEYSGQPLEDFIVK